MKIKTLLILLLVSAALLLSACSAAEPTATGAAPVSTEPYPAPEVYLPQTGSDAGSTGGTAPALPAYPGPGADGSLAVVPFRLDKPIPASASEITGSGPAYVPVMVLDATAGNLILGIGRIGEDGKFSLPVSGLTAGNQVGIVLGVLEGTPWTAAMFTQAFFGDEPVTGQTIYFDTTVIQE